MIKDLSVAFDLLYKYTLDKRNSKCVSELKKKKINLKLDLDIIDNLQ